LEIAAEAARLLLVTPGITQEQVTVQATDLAVAIAAVVLKGDKSVLIALINAAQSLREADFTPSSWARLAVALTDAIAVRDNPDASTHDVEGTYQALTGALEGLVLRAAKAGLKSSIDVATSILANAALYIPSTLVGLREALDGAQAVYANPDATQAEVSTAQAALLAKIAGARLRAAPVGMSGSLLPPGPAARAAQEPMG
jgi:hypothetical protein